MAHQSFATASAGTPAGTPVASSSSAAAVSSPRHKSRGSGGLRPDFVFPKPSSSVASQADTKLDPHSSSSTTVADKANGDSNGTCTSGTENADSLVPPKTQQHLKTHYRTHSRNGSTVTVKDLKQAIAAVQTELLDMPSPADSSDSGGSAKSLTETSEKALPILSVDQTSEAATETPQDAPLQSNKPALQGLTLQVNLPKQSLMLDSTSAPSTPLLSPVSPRPNSARDRSNMTVPPSFAFSIPHEFPSAYYAPRLLLPGSAGPTPLPTSPFARKRKHAYHHTPATFPSPTITVKLPGQGESVNCSHQQSVGLVPDIELVDYDFDDTGLEQYPMAESSTVDTTPEPSEPQGKDIGHLQNVPHVTVAEDSQPSQGSSPTHDEDEIQTISPPPLDDEEASQLANGRLRKPIPPPLNLGSSTPESVAKSIPGSPMTPVTPGRRRRSKSRDRKAKQDKDGNRSNSSNRAQADNGSGRGSSGKSVPPVPQTPSWVPGHTGPPSATGTAPTFLAAPTSGVEPSSPGAMERPVSPAALSPRHPNPSNAGSGLERRGPRPARLLNTRPTNNLQTFNEGGHPVFTPRSARDGSSDYFSMRPLQHPPRTPMTPGGDFGEDDDEYRLQMLPTPMIQHGFFPNWAKGDAQLEELERIREFLSARQYPDEMPLSDEWTLFFSDTSRAKEGDVEGAYSSAITPLFSCGTVPQFATSWKYVRERVKPANLGLDQNLHWFKKGVKPMWEDPKNKYGGRLTLSPPRVLLDVVWETVLILMAGDVLDFNGETTGAVLARRKRGDRVEVWLSADDTPEAVAHIQGVLMQELAGEGAEEIARTAKYKKHFSHKGSSRQHSSKESAPSTPGAGPSTNGNHGLSSPMMPTTPRMNSSGNLGDFQSFEAFKQHQQQQQQLRERGRGQERERERERDGERGASKDQERIMQLGKERLEKEREKEKEKDRLRDEKIRAMAAAAVAATEAKHQQQLKGQ
ncbi:hypothetical protein B0O80DRAFT_422149 [Mortierella sp. GBAus27b]|nr:hypothetical protein BGX31_010043 [Mortierella sp. GBA43]KAI8361030.1 hypothetical protein B0O80DRAFT_422149 [Mortierella sp. GBAus27b]